MIVILLLLLLLRCIQRTDEEALLDPLHRKEDTTVGHSCHHALEEVQDPGSRIGECRENSLSCRSRGSGVFPTFLPELQQNVQRSGFSPTAGAPEPTQESVSEQEIPIRDQLMDLWLR